MTTVYILTAEKHDVEKIVGVFSSYEGVSRTLAQLGDVKHYFAMYRIYRHVVDGVTIDPRPRWSVVSEPGTAEVCTDASQENPLSFDQSPWRPAVPQVYETKHEMREDVCLILSGVAADNKEEARRIARDVFLDYFTTRQGTIQ